MSKPYFKNGRKIDFQSFSLYYCKYNTAVKFTTVECITSYIFPIMRRKASLRALKDTDNGIYNIGLKLFKLFYFPY